MKSLCLSVVASFCAAAFAAQGQNIFILPGTNSISGNVGVVSTITLTSTTNFTAGSGAFQVLAAPAGNKYYVISNSGSATVTAVDSAFTNPRSLGNFGTQATAAAISPNGSRLLVTAGTLHEFDTNTDFDLFPNGQNYGASLFDVAISLDGTRAFLLGRNPAGGSTLYAIDLSNNNMLIGSIPVPGNATGVTVGPNGFVYVSTLNEVLEINPNPFAITTAGTIPLNANPGKLVFTPDGKFGLATNQTPITGSSVIVIDLAAHTVFGTVPNFNTVLDKLFVAGNNSVIAYSSQTQSLYQITLVPLNINALSLPGIQLGAVTTAALSNDVSGGSRSSTQYLYFVSNGILYRYDLVQGTLSGQLALPSGAGAISLPAPANTTGAPATILQYGNNQTIAAGAVASPLVVRVLDANGLPVSGVAVGFSSAAAGVTIQNATVNTSTDGFAMTTVTAPATSGVFIVTATLPGGQTVNFNIGVGSSVGTGGGTSSQVSIVAGQGQILYENFNTGTTGFGSPLTVLVKDISGNPVANGTVTFSIISGPGSLLASGVQGAGNGPTVAVTTDANGLASAAFLSSSVNPGSGFQQTAIAASASGTNTVNFYITTTTQTPQGIFVVFNKPQPGDVITGQAGTTLPGAVTATVTSIRGPVPNVSIRVLTSGATDPSMGPFVTCADPNGTGVLSDMNGNLICNLVFGPKIGVGQFQVNVGYFINSTNFFTFTTTPGPPSAIRIIQGNNQTGSQGQTLPLAFLFQVTDAGGNPLPGIPATFQVTPAGAVTLTNQISTTDSNGNASALGKLGNIAGPATVKVSAGSASATFTVNVNIPVTGIQPVSGGGQIGLVNVGFGAPLVVKVANASGAGVAGVPVTFSVAGGSATLGSPSATTDANGQASTTVTAGPNAGPITITATANGFSTSFALTSRLPGPTNITFVNGASFQQGISPGSIVTINGTGILPGVQGLITANSIVGPLPQSLAGVQILFNGIPAPIYSVSNQNGVESVTVQVPFEIPVGPTTVVINAAGGGSTTINNVQVSQYSPGVFESLFNGQKQAVAIRPDGSYVSPGNPAQRGEVDCIFATGLGQVSPGTTTGSAGLAGQNVLGTLDVGVNNGGVRLVSATYLPGTVGVYMICLQIPSDATPGPAQPIGLDIHDSSGNTIFAQSTFIPIQ